MSYFILFICLVFSIFITLRAHHSNRILYSQFRRLPIDPFVDLKNSHYNYSFQLSAQNFTTRDDIILSTDLIVVFYFTSCCRPPIQKLETLSQELTSLVIPFVRDTISEIRFQQILQTKSEIEREISHTLENVTNERYYSIKQLE